MLRIRLRRVGKKGKPSYRIVVADSAAPRDGAYLEWIGNYDPMADPPAITIKEDRAVQWLSKGAQPSDAVARILDKNGLYQRIQEFRNDSIGSTEGPAPSAVASTVPTEVVVEAVASTEASAAETPVDDVTADAPTDEESEEASTEEASTE
ncbi:MAG: 30S ribosomal protein S16 [SAR202 cluster bacterium Io17-Chloro-G7]|nr:MAG: 30S ribosomal protein S16 [SAR202 cluster bacterium Io17-Chloro-G7]